jgi:hypothetical protein
MTELHYLSATEALHAFRARTLSPVELMEAVIERTAMSPFIREKNDYFAGILDARGRVVCGTMVPLFGNLTEIIFAQYPAGTMRPGDLYWYNDCHGSRGGVSHSPDMVFAAPVFHRGRLVAFSQTWGHFWDIGGMRAGSISPDATEIFHEGIIVPAVRIYREGVLNDEVFRMFLRNSRFPDILRGDIRAVLAGCRLGERRVLDAGWISEMLRPCALNPNYGLLWWLNTGRAQAPSAPPSCYAARGAGSNVIWIDPENDLVVIVRWIDKSSFDGFIALVLESVMA